jgi:hypothetical protein
MNRSAPSRLLAALALGAALLAPAAVAAPRPHPAPRVANTAQPGSLDLLSRLWAALTSLWSEEGCSIDPDGRCAAKPSAPSVDNGCSLDPSGRCQ